MSQKFDRVIPGQLPPARTFNRPIAAVEALTKLSVGPGLSLQTVAGVPILSADVASTGGGLIRVQIPVGEIPSGASTTVTLYDADHTLGTDTLTAFNRSGGVIGDATTAKVGYIAWIAREGEWQIVQEVC